MPARECVAVVSVLCCLDWMMLAEWEGSAVPVEKAGGAFPGALGRGVKALWVEGSSCTKEEAAPENRCVNE